MAKLRNFFEMSEAPSPDGRRRIKVSLHEIHPDNSVYNLNGITYLEKYTEKNAPTIVGMPLCASFLDDDNEIPYDHGQTGSDGNMPEFKNSVQVGVCDGWSIEDVVLDGENKRVCMAVGYVNQQRYPDFVKWLEDKQSISQSVFGSVEFVGTKENGEIIYDGGWKEKGRIPAEYVYSGYVFLTVKPSDNAARMIEINEKLEQEGEKGMTIEELCTKFDSFVARYDEENACKKELESNAATIIELNATVDQLKIAIEENKKEVSSKYEEIDALYKERDMLRDELAKIKMEARIGEMNAALSEYSNEEKALVANDIAAFNADPMTIEINAVVQKLEAAAYRKLREKNIAETNARKESFDVEDIFAAIDPVDSKDAVIDFSDMLG
jgi:hypothetical protein